MISLRYHLVSLAAAFLALAVGVALGATALSGTVPGVEAERRAEKAGPTEAVRAERDALRARVAGLDAFTGSIGPEAVGGVLEHRSVTVVSTPGVAPSTRDGVTGLLGQAGANVTGQVRLARAMTDPAQAKKLRELVLRLQPAGVHLPVEARHGALAGALLGSVLLRDLESRAPQSTHDERAAALSGLTEGGFVTSADVSAAADLAVVLTSEPAPDAGAVPGVPVLARFATRLDHAGAGTVLAGPAAAAHENGVLGAARSDPRISADLSTVDGVDTPAGRIAVVLALREQWKGQAGRYGMAGNAQAPIPSS